MIIYKFKSTVIFLLLYSISLYGQEVIVVGNSNSNDFEYISSSLSEINIEHSIWENFNENLLIDSLLMINNSIVLWQIDSSLSNNILSIINQKINNNNSFLLFSNNIINNEVINNLFGFTKIRNSFSESILDLNNDQNWSFNQNSIISELSWIGSAYPKYIYAETNAFSAVHKNFSNGRTLFSGFKLDIIQDLPSFLEDLFLTYLSYYNTIVIDDISGTPGDTLYIPIHSNFINDVIGISFTIQCDPDFLYFFDMESSSNINNFVWDINPMPFGIVEINGASTDGFLESGQSELGFLKVFLYPSSTNKVSLIGIENIITYNSGESSSALFKNGEVDILYDYSIVELVPPSLIQPDSIGIMDINLSTNHSITAIQLCLSYDANTIGINNVYPTFNIPNNWFVTFVNHPENNISEIFCFGFEPIGPISGSIIEIELESYSQNSSIESIDFCDILLAGSDSDNIYSYGIDTDVIVDYPDLSIIPTSIIVNNNLDILFNIDGPQIITGFQYDISFENNLDLINVIKGHFAMNFIGNWTLLDNNVIRFIYFDESSYSYPMGTLLLTSFIFEENIEQFGFNVRDVIITDQNYEILSVEFEDFEFLNESSDFGDSNGDDSIDIYDIIIIINYIIGNDSIGDAQKLISDINNDGELTVEDIIFIINDILY